MTDLTLTGIVIRETEKAVAFVSAGNEAKVSWLPLSKIISRTELDLPSRPFHDGKATRQGIPHLVVVNGEFAERINLGA